MAVTSEGGRKQNSALNSGSVPTYRLAILERQCDRAATRELDAAADLCFAKTLRVLSFSFYQCYRSVRKRLIYHFGEGQPKGVEMTDRAVRAFAGGCLL
jgi:hypothetical protein